MEMIKISVDEYKKACKAYEPRLTNEINECFSDLERCFFLNFRGQKLIREKLNRLLEKRNDYLSNRLTLSYFDNTEILVSLSTLNELSTVYKFDIGV